MPVGSLLVNPLGVVPETAVDCLRRQGSEELRIFIVVLVEFVWPSLGADLQKTCEMGAGYETLRAEKVQFAGELDAAMVAMAGMKDVLAEWEKSLEQAREANKALTAEVEKMGKHRTGLMGQMKVLNRRCIAPENYVSDWSRKMIALLGGTFCFSECLWTMHFILC